MENTSLGFILCQKNPLIELINAYKIDFIATNKGFFGEKICGGQVEEYIMRAYCHQYVVK